MDDSSNSRGGRRVYRPTASSSTRSPADDVVMAGGDSAERAERNGERGGRSFNQFGRRGQKPERGNSENNSNPVQGEGSFEGTPSTVALPSIKHLEELRSLSNDDLFVMAEEVGVKDPANLRRHELMFRVVEKIQKQSPSPEIRGEGCLDIVPDGFGFLRSRENNYTGTPEDIYVSPSLIRRLGLRAGDMMTGTVRFPNPGERYFALVNVETLHGNKPEQQRHRRNFDKLTPLYPTEKFNLEGLENTVDAAVKTVGGKLVTAKPAATDRTGQVIDLVAPIGKGQRCMMVAPPKAGKTMMMKAVAHAIESKHPEVTLMVLLVDERPEEVTDMERSVKGEVISSTFDEPASRHVQVSEMVIEKAKRLVELGQDVVILLDSLTRLARAYNTVVPSSGKVLTGGVDAHALQKPKRFFGAARKIEEGGSLTIIATALIDTGSRMDEVIFEEFKGTGNSEIWMDRKLTEKRTYPAIDISKSGTRHEELLYTEEELQKIWILRRILQPMGVVESMEFLLDKLKRTKTNAEFFKFMNQ